MGPISNTKAPPKMFSLMDQGDVTLTLTSLFGNAAANKTFAKEMSMATFNVPKKNPSHADGQPRHACRISNNIGGLGACGLDKTGHSHTADINAIDPYAA